MTIVSRIEVLLPSKMGNGSGRSGSHIPRGTVVDDMVREYGSKVWIVCRIGRTFLGFPLNSGKLKIFKQEFRGAREKNNEKDKIKRI